MIAGGILLLGATPALADSQPAPGAAPGPLGRLGDTLEQTGDWRLGAPLAADPLSGEPLIDLSTGEGRLLGVKPGTNSIGQRSEKTALPAADVVSGTLPDTGRVAPKKAQSGQATGPIPVTGEILAREISHLPFDKLVGSKMPAFGALGPDGLPVAQNTRIDGPGEKPATWRAESTKGTRSELPLIGGIGAAGLGGAVPVAAVQQRLDRLGTDVSGLPLGGSALGTRPARTVEAPAKEVAKPRAVPTTPAPSTAVTDVPDASIAPSPAASETSASAPAPSESVRARDMIDDPRLLEEPTEGLD